MFGNIALKVYMNELLALKTALTGENSLDRYGEVCKYGGRFLERLYKNL